LVETLQKIGKLEKLCRALQDERGQMQNQIRELKKENVEVQFEKPNENENENEKPVQSENENPSENPCENEKPIQNENPAQNEITEKQS